MLRWFNFSIIWVISLYSYAGLAKDIDLRVPYIKQETNLCVPTSAAMVLSYYGQQHLPREIKTWSRGQEYQSELPFSDFTATFFPDLILGLHNHGIDWIVVVFPNDELGFKSGIKQIKNQLDMGFPVIVDTALFRGHTFVITGYNSDGATWIIADPNKDFPGRSEIRNEDFYSIWNSVPVGSNRRGAIFTKPPQ